MTTASAARRETFRKSKAKFREAMRRAGMVRRDVYAHPADWPKIQALAARLARAREKDSEPPP